MMDERSMIPMMRISIQDIGKKGSEAPEIHRILQQAWGSCELFKSPRKVAASHKIVTCQNEKTLLQQCSRV